MAPYPLGQNTMIVGICYDKRDNVFLKWGEPDLVEKWFNRAQRLYRASGYNSIADDTILFFGDVPQEELEKMKDIAGYVGKYFRTSVLLQTNSKTSKVR